MAKTFTRVDLSQLPPPDVVEQIDYEAILAEMIADLRQRDPTFDALVESDPAYKILEVAAYREALIRQRVNEACKAVMLAFAKGADLDQIGANFGLQRQVVDPGDPNAVPPVPPTYESDADFRARIQLSFEGYTTAGSEGSYVFHGLNAGPDVKDVQAVSPEPGKVTVYVLSRTGDGEASAELLEAVEAALNDEDVRPLTDQVTVETATIVPYTVEAELEIEAGPDAEVVLQAARAALEQYVTDMHRIGRTVALSGIYQALHRPGVVRVTLTEPSADIETSDGEAPYCEDITLSIAVGDDGGEDDGGDD